MPKVSEENRLTEWHVALLGCSAAEAEAYHRKVAAGTRPDDPRKSPVTGRSWERKATEAEIKAHLAKGEEYRLGLCPGRCSPPLVAVDVDLREDMKARNDKPAAREHAERTGVRYVKEQLGEPLHQAETQSGGAHLFYRARGDERNAKLEFDDFKIDIRGVKGYVVLWNGRATLDALDAALDDPTLPSVDVNRLRPKAGTKKDTRPDDVRLAELPEGGRNNALNLAAFMAALNGANRAETHAKLHEACLKNRYIPDEGEARFEGTFAQGWNAGCAAAKLGQDLSEGELAESFSKLFPEFRHHRIHGWMRFGQGVWTLIPTPYVRDQLFAFLKDSKPDDPKAQKTWRRNFRAVTARGTEYFAQSAARITGTFDAQPDRCGISGGQVLDLRTATLRRGHEGDWISRRLGTVPADIPTPAWDQLLAQIAPDKERRIYLQRFVGYVLTGDTHLHKFLFVQGPGGSGKTTFVNVLRALLGEYHRAVAPDALVGRREAHSEWLARLDGARLITIGDLATGAWKANLLKNLTGGEPVVANYMHQNSFEYQPVCKVIIAGEHKPKIERVDEGMKRRMVLVKVPRLAAKDRDSQLPERLMQELPGIAHWALIGARAYYKAGRKLPREPKAWAGAADAYFEEEDTIGAWFRECIELEGSGFLTGRELTTSYNMHTRAHLTRATRLYEWLEMQGFGVRGTRNGATGFRGIRMRSRKSDDGDLDPSDF